MKTYTIVRNGSIPQTNHGEHYCGFADAVEFPYRVELTVRGQLQPPQYFIIANEEMHDVVIRTCAGHSMSCERMADSILDAMHSHVTANYSHWEIIKLHVELTGTNGRANLSADYQAQ